MFIQFHPCLCFFCYIPLRRKHTHATSQHAGADTSWATVGQVETSRVGVDTRIDCGSMDRSLSVCTKTTTVTTMRHHCRRRRTHPLRRASGRAARRGAAAAAHTVYDDADERTKQSRRDEDIPVRALRRR